MKPEDALAQAGLVLPEPLPPVANFVMAVRSGSLLFVSGHGSFVDGQPAHLGKLGADMTVASGQKAAEVVMLNLFSTLKNELGELSRVERFVKLLVMVNATPEFAEHHLVANGATDLLVAVFGPKGKPARSAVGVASLPLGFAVEIEAVVEIRT